MYVFERDGEVKTTQRREVQAECRWERASAEAEGGRAAVWLRVGVWMCGEWSELR